MGSLLSTVESSVEKMKLLVILYLCVFAVSGLPQGAYRYAQDLISNQRDLYQQFQYNQNQYQYQDQNPSNNGNNQNEPTSYEDEGAGAYEASQSDSLFDWLG